jgi:hypothetical protein
MVARADVAGELGGADVGDAVSDVIETGAGAADPSFPAAGAQPAISNNPPAVATPPRRRRATIPQLDMTAPVQRFVRRTAQIGRA